MSADGTDKPATKVPEAEVIDLEMVDEGSSAAAGGHTSLEDFAKMGPQMLVQAFRDLLKEKLKRWFIRSLVWATILLLLAQEFDWVFVVFWIWAFFAFIHLAFLLYGWYASGKQSQKLMQILGGINPAGRHMHMKDRDD